MGEANTSIPALEVKGNPMSGLSRAESDKLGCCVLPKLSVIRWLGRLDLGYEKIKPTWFYRRGLARKITSLGSHKGLHQSANESLPRELGGRSSQHVYGWRPMMKGRPLTGDKAM